MIAYLLWKVFTPGCNSGGCVNVENLGEDGVRLTSTLGADRGSVTYDNTEWANFVASVKAGEADHTVSLVAAQ